MSRTDPFLFAFRPERSAQRFRRRQGQLPPHAHGHEFGTCQEEGQAFAHHGNHTCLPH